MFLNSVTFPVFCVKSPIFPGFPAGVGTLKFSLEKLHTKAYGHLCRSQIDHRLTFYTYLCSISACVPYQVLLLI